MKKRLLLLCFVGVTVGLFAGEESAKESQVEVTAEVIKPLTITTKAVKFGKVAQGTHNTTPKEQGEITIAGQEGQNIKIKYAGVSGAWQDNIKDVKVQLKQGNKAGVLTYTPEFTKEFVTNLPGGNTTASLGGVLEVPEDAEVGSYVGNLKVKVFYE